MSTTPTLTGGNIPRNLNGTIKNGIIPFYGNTPTIGQFNSTGTGYANSTGALTVSPKFYTITLNSSSVKQLSIANWIIDETIHYNACGYSSSCGGFSATIKENLPIDATADPKYPNLTYYSNESDCGEDFTNYMFALFTDFEFPSQAWCWVPESCLTHVFGQNMSDSVSGSGNSPTIPSDPTNPQSGMSADELIQITPINSSKKFNTSDGKLSSYKTDNGNGDFSQQPALYFTSLQFNLPDPIQNVMIDPIIPQILINYYKEGFLSEWALADYMLKYSFANIIDPKDGQKYMRSNVKIDNQPVGKQPSDIINFWKALETRSSTSTAKKTFDSVYYLPSLENNPTYILNYCSTVNINNGIYTTNINTDVCKAYCDKGDCDSIMESFCQWKNPKVSEITETSTLDELKARFPNWANNQSDCGCFMYTSPDPDGFSTTAGNNLSGNGSTFYKALENINMGDKIKDPTYAKSIQNSVSSNYDKYGPECINNVCINSNVKHKSWSIGKKGWCPTNSYYELGYNGVQGGKAIYQQSTGKIGPNYTGMATEIAKKPTVSTFSNISNVSNISTFGSTSCSTNGYIILLILSCIIAFVYLRKKRS